MQRACAYWEVKNMKLGLLSAASIVGSVLLAGSAWATTQDTDSSSMAVSLSVENTCSINSSSLSFGTVDVGTIEESGKTATGSVNVTCSSGTSFHVLLGDGAASSATGRYMSSGTNKVYYHIYTTSGGSTEWDDQSVDTASTGTGEAQNVSIYGEILSSENTSVAAGSYSDTVSVTVAYDDGLD